MPLGFADSHRNMLSIGEIFSLNLVGQHALVVNSHKVAADLLDRRSNIYSDRPRFILGNEILCDNLFIGVTHYGDLCVYSVSVTMFECSHCSISIGGSAFVRLLMKALD